MLPQTTRLQSVDLLRGLVMVLMAIDHVRVYAGVPAGGPDPAVFFTRWITHFCVPVFVFFAGTGAFFNGRKLNDKKALSRFLLTRGLVLVSLELTIIRFGWTFNFDYKAFTLAGVIWMLGWCMVLLSALVRLKPVTVGIIGLIIAFGQRLFWYIGRIVPESAQTAVGWIWGFIYPSELPGAPFMAVLYVLVPWIGVMAAGYGFGLILLKEAAVRRRLCLIIGLSATAIFLITGSIIAAKQPASTDGPPPPFLFRLLNQQKYPASQLYLLMTLGPIIALLPLAERARGWFANILVVFGRVPMFYYLLHIPLIHMAALLVNTIRIGNTGQQWYGSAPFAGVPSEHRWSLPLLYLVFLVVVTILYFLCHWFMKLKATSTAKWLKYI